ncbi:hypothetical protein FKM82_027469 [Ascaphus truei]
MMDFKLFGNGLITRPRLMGGNNCFAKIIADVFPPWHCVNTHLNAPDQQTAKTSTFIEEVTLADDQLIKDICLAAPVCYLAS